MADTITVEHTYNLTDGLDKYYSASTTAELLKNVVGAMKGQTLRVNIAVKQPDGHYLVQISGIPATRLDYTNTVRCVTDKGEFNVKLTLWYTS